MESSYLFSIGHGNKSIAEFIAELTQFDIQYLIDIRSKPYSKFYPWFNHYELSIVIMRQLALNCEVITMRLRGNLCYIV